MFDFIKNLKLKKSKSSSDKPKSKKDSLNQANLISSDETQSQKSNNKPHVLKVPETTFSGQGGINLIPPVPLEIRQKKEEYVTLGVNFAFAVLILIILTITIAGFNLWVQLDNKIAQKNLSNMESAILEKSPILIRNEQLVNRIFIYQSIEDTLYDPKTVLSYWDTTLTNFGEIDEVKINNDLYFEITGHANSLSDVATIWHLLSVDSRVNKVILDSFAKQSSKDNTSIVSFTFIGQLNFEAFKLKVGENK